MYQSTIVYNSVVIYAFCFVLLFSKINYNENYSVSIILSKVIIKC